MKEAKQIVMKACKINHVEFDFVLSRCNLDSGLLRNVGQKPDNFNNINLPEPLRLSTDQNEELPENGDKLTNKVEIKYSQKTANCHDGILVRKYTALDILKSKTILLNSLIIWYAW